LFAGLPRPGDLGQCLHRAAAEASAATGLSLEVALAQVDRLLDEAAGDLAKKATQDRYCERIAAGEFQLVVASPPCSTLNRPPSRASLGRCRFGASITCLVFHGERQETKRMRRSATA
jgi:hypothetical protein